MRRVAALVLLAGWTALAWAHTTSTGVATLQVQDERLSYRLTLNAAELDGRADDLVRASRQDAQALSQVAAWLPEHLSLEVQGKPCRIARTRIQGSVGGDDRIGLWVEFACASEPGVMRLTDRLWARWGEHYRTIVSASRTDGGREERVLDASSPQARWDWGRPAVTGFAAFVRLGAGHILSGADHLLFLAALLLGGVGLARLLATVTAFTLAHSIALAGAVLGWLSVSPAIVEPLIAASIVWVALENLFLAEIAAWRRSVLAFGFGLVHGLAFSEVLRDLQLHGSALAGALFGFNLGVELGQGALVALLAPVLAWLARRGVSGRWTQAASAGIGLAGLFWLVERLMAL
jgi:HupE / UreJ protein